MFYFLLCEFVTETLIGARRYLAIFFFFFFSCSRMQTVNLKNSWRLTSYLPCCLRNSLLQLFLNIDLLFFYLSGLQGVHDCWWWPANFLGKTYFLVGFKSKLEELSICTPKLRHTLSFSICTCALNWHYFWIVKHTSLVILITFAYLWLCFLDYYFFYSLKTF